MQHKLPICQILLIIQAKKDDVSKTYALAPEGELVFRFSARYLAATPDNH